MQTSVLFRHQYSTMAKSFSEMNATVSEECDGLVVSECMYHKGHRTQRRPSTKTQISFLSSDSNFGAANSANSVSFSQMVFTES